MSISFANAIANLVLYRLRKSIKLKGKKGVGTPLNPHYPLAVKEQGLCLCILAN